MLLLIILLGIYVFLGLLGSFIELTMAGEHIRINPDCKAEEVRKCKRELKLIWGWPIAAAVGLWEMVSGFFIGIYHLIRG